MASYEPSEEKMCFWGYLTIDNIDRPLLLLNVLGAIKVFLRETLGPVDNKGSFQTAHMIRTFAGCML